MTERGKTAFIGALIGGMPLVLVATSVAYARNPAWGAVEGFIFYVLLIGSSWLLAKTYDRNDD